jgi:hypothetical protein
VAAPSLTGLFYERKSADGWSLRHCALDGTGDREVLTGMLDRAFGVTSNGIYFIPMPSPDERSSIRFLDFSTGKVNSLTPIQKPERRPVSVALDGSYLLFTQFEQWGRDAALIEYMR